MSIFGDVWGGITGAAGSIGGAIGGLARQAAPAILGGIAQGIAGGIQQRISGPQVVTGGGPVGTGPVYNGGWGAPRFEPAGYVQQPVSAGRLQMAGFPTMGGPVGGQIIPASMLPVPQPGTGFLGMDPDVPSFFQPTKTTVRPIRLLTAVNPISGKMAFWEHCGTPVLFSRDLRVCKRVAKIAARASRGRPRKRGRKK